MLGLLRFSLAIAICQACCGCTLYTHGKHVLLTDPLHFPNNINHISTRHRFRKIGKQYLNDFYCANDHVPASKEYSDGFLDGFEDYITYGARQAPPALPPRRYWKKHYTTPEGFGVVHDWHAGFADGSLQAASSGLRELQTVPSSLLVPRFAPAIDSETLPPTTPEPLGTIDAPVGRVRPLTTPPRPMVPEVHFLLEPIDEQATYQARPLPKADGALQPASYQAEKSSHVVGPRVAKYDLNDAASYAQQAVFESRQPVEGARQPVERAVAHAPMIDADSRWQFSRLPAVPAPTGEPVIFTPLTSN